MGLGDRTGRDDATIGVGEALRNGRVTVRGVTVDLIDEQQRVRAHACHIGEEGLDVIGARSNAARVLRARQAHQGRRWVRAGAMTSASNR
jgi:hypothetical protein